MGNILIGMIIGISIMQLRSFFKEGPEPIKKEASNFQYSDWDISDPKNQLKFIKGATLYPRKPVNVEAYKAVYIAAESTIKTLKSKHRLLAEVSLGSFIGTKGGASKKAEDRAFSSFNSKRADFLVIDAVGDPKLVIEYNGSGHYLSDDAEQRDEVKKLALDRAGIPLLVFSEGVSKREVENKVRWWLTKYNKQS